MLISTPLIKWSVNFCNPNFQHFGLKILYTLLTFLTLACLQMITKLWLVPYGVNQSLISSAHRLSWHLIEQKAFYQGGDLLVAEKQLLWRPLTVVRFLSLIPLLHLGKEPQKKFLFQIMCLTLFCCLNKFFFFTNVSLISFILMCYRLFHVNFLYLKDVFHLICVF